VRCGDISITLTSEFAISADMGMGRPFYDLLPPALGFTHDAKIARWVQYEGAGETEAPVFVGLTESARHVANECRIAFW
jgi:hypothetical protein